jgi:hypothetical protein
MPEDMAMGPTSPVASAADRQGILNLLPHASAVGLNLPENLSFEEWREIGRKLGRAKSTLQWWIADWWVHGEHQYGERTHQVESLGLSFQTCANYGRVARAFRETSRRRELLSFAHHEAVAALKPEDANQLLNWCLEGVAEGKRDRRRVWELRNEITSRRIKTAEEARIDEEVAAALKKVVVTKVVHEPSTVTVSILRPEPPERPIAAQQGLDDSGYGGPVPAKLAALTVEPPPPIDRVAVAATAIGHLEFDKALAVVLDWFNQRTQPERNAIRAAIRSISERWRPRYDNQPGGDP